MEFLIYMCMITLALGICGFFSDLVYRRMFGNKSDKKVLVHVYAGDDRYISCYAKKCIVDKSKNAKPSDNRCA